MCISIAGHDINSSNPFGPDNIFGEHILGHVTEGCGVKPRFHHPSVGNANHDSFAMRKETCQR